MCRPLCTRSNYSVRFFSFLFPRKTDIAKEASPREEARAINKEQSREEIVIARSFLRVRPTSSDVSRNRPLQTRGIFLSFFVFIPRLRVFYSPSLSTFSEIVWRSLVPHFSFSHHLDVLDGSCDLEILASVVLGV